MINYAAIKRPEPKHKQGVIMFKKLPGWFLPLAILLVMAGCGRKPAPSDAPEKPGVTAPAKSEEAGKK